MAPITSKPSFSQSDSELHSHPGVGEGLDRTLLLGGAGLVLLGVGAAAVGFLTDYGLRLGPVPIPLSIVGPLVALGGGFVGYRSLRQKKCLHCDESLTPVTAWFPPDDEAQVVAAINTNPVDLTDLPMQSAADASVQVSVEYCAKCEGVATVEVSTFRPDRTEVLNRVITRPLLTPLIAVMKVRDAAHQARFESAES